MGLSPPFFPLLSPRCVTLLFVACAIYDPDEDYVGELRESGFGWPSCSFDAGWDDDQFCPSVFVGAAAENLFETVRTTALVSRSRALGWNRLQSAAMGRRGSKIS